MEEIPNNLMSREEIEVSLKEDGFNLQDFLRFCANRNSIAYVENPSTGKLEKFVTTGYHEDGAINGHFLDD